MSKAGKFISGGAVVALVVIAWAAPEPFVLAPCADRNEYKNPYFGDLHVHTSFSLDAQKWGTRNGPSKAYLFAKGVEVGLPPYDAYGNPLRTTQIDRRLHFSAATDHSEWLQAEHWLAIQDAANRHYNPCSFTTFIGYEYSLGDATFGETFNMYHRNVIFANATVPSSPIGFNVARTPEELWNNLNVLCKLQGNGCDVVAIPHNTNFSNGLTFSPTNFDGSPLTPDGAALRAMMEPIVEVFQAKGDSECLRGLGTTDELCNFEKINGSHGQNPQYLNFARNALKTGLAVEQILGVNPFKFGLIGSTDTHNATPGHTKEPGWPGKTGVEDDTPEERLSLDTPGGIIPSQVTFNPGGLAVIWAEQNTRESLFNGLRSREVYATSGTRPIVRFFGGVDFPADICASEDLARLGYENGVPMGSDLKPEAGAGGISPKFLVMAEKDIMPLQRIQIIKGYLDDAGVPREEVFEVAGNPDNGAGVDVRTCKPYGTGYGRLCKVWSDPKFRADQSAFYYVRVLENPTCRWSQYECAAKGVTGYACLNPPAGYEACCVSSLPKTIQEKAWTSPIWYTP